MTPGFSNSEELGRVLRGLAARVPPPELGVRFRVLASREQQRTVNRCGFLYAFSKWRERVQLSAGDWMRPLAVPCAGGLFSAVALFSMWLVPTYPMPHATGSDVPTMLTTPA